MGTWSAAAFDNDAASELVCALHRSEGLCLLETLFEQADDVGSSLSESLALQVVAGCELLAGLTGERSYELDSHDQAAGWVDRQREQPSLDVLRKAARALMTVMNTFGEHPQLWPAVDIYREWRRYAHGLLLRLEIRTPAPSEFKLSSRTPSAPARVGRLFGVSRRTQ